MDTLHKGDHVILIHEDSDYARAIEFDFLHEGLKRGERCFYSTIFDNPVEIERKMERFGIDVKTYKERDLFRAITLPSSPIADTSRVALENDELREIFSNSDSKRTPFRFIGRLYPLELFSKEQLAENLRIEKQTEAEFKDQNGIAICSYSSKNLMSTLSKKVVPSTWLIEMLRAHDVAVFAPGPGRGAAFHMN